MRILYVSQYFPPEMGAPAARVFEVSREWVKAGHRVTVLTGFPNHPEGRVRDAYRARFWRLTCREVESGIEVVRTWLYPSANKGTLGRSLNYASFCASALCRGLTLERPDVVIGSSPQPLVALAAEGLARRFGVPFVFEVRDLWPESLPAVGQTGEASMMYRTVRRVADYLYTRAALIAVASPGFVDPIKQRFPAARLTIAQNGVDTAIFSPRSDAAALRRQLGFENRFLVTYTGTIGMAHGLNTVLDAADRLRHTNPQVTFALVGEGAERGRLQESARARGLTNVSFVGQVPRSDVVNYINASDVCLVHLRRQPLFETVLPSKMFECMACARPMIFGVAGVAAGIVESAGAGIVIAPDDVDQLFAAVQRLADDAAMGAAMGARGLDYVLKNCTRARHASLYAAALQTMLEPQAVSLEASVNAGIQ